MIYYLPLSKVTLLAPEADMATPNAAATASESLVPADCRPSTVLKSLCKVPVLSVTKVHIHLFRLIVNQNCLLNELTLPGPFLFPVLVSAAVKETDYSPMYLDVEEP